NPEPIPIPAPNYTGSSAMQNFAMVASRGMSLNICPWDCPCGGAHFERFPGRSGRMRNLQKPGTFDQKPSQRNNPKKYYTAGQGVVPVDSMKNTSSLHHCGQKTAKMRSRARLFDTSPDRVRRYCTFWQKSTLVWPATIQICPYHTRFLAGPDKSNTLHFPCQWKVAPKMAGRPGTIDRNKETSDIEHST